MNASVHRQLNRRKRRILRRIENQPGVERHQPMMAASNIHYEIADRTRAIAPGGIGAIHLLARKLGLIEDIDRGPPPAEAAPAVLRERPRPEHRLQPPGRRQPPGAPRGPPQRRGLPRRPRGRTHPRPDHRRGLLPPLHRGRRRAADGHLQRDPAAGLEAAARRLLRRGLHRRRRGAGPLGRLVQAGRGHRLRRDLGLPPAGGLAGQHRRAAVPGQPQRQPALARARRRLPRQGRRPLPPGGVPQDHLPGRHQVHPDEAPGPLGHATASASSSGSTPGPTSRGWPSGCPTWSTANWSARPGTRSRRCPARPRSGTRSGSSPSGSSTP